MRETIVTTNPKNIVPNAAGNNPTATLMEAAGSDAPGFPKCGCCGQPGRKRIGCSCVSGKSHPCLTAAAGHTPRNILEGYLFKNKKCVAIDPHLQKMAGGASSSSPAVPLYDPTTGREYKLTTEGRLPQAALQAQVKTLKRRRIVLKPLKRSPAEIPTPDDWDVLLDDSDVAATATKRGREEPVPA